MSGLKLQAAYVVFNRVLACIKSLNRNILRVGVVLPMRTKVWNLGVESVFEQWDTVGEYSHCSSGSTSPNDEITGVSLDSSEVVLGNLINGTSNVLLS